MMQVKNAERIARTCIRHPRGENIPMKALYNDGSVAELPQDEVTHVIRHSAAHIMAQAIKRLYPEADFAYGPATDNGFYYDVDLPEGVKISEDDFPAIEAEMKKIVKENLKFTVFESPAPRPSPLWRSAARSTRSSTSATWTTTPHHLLPAGRLHRHVRRPPHLLHQGAEGL